MNDFEWKEDYETGVYKIDEQHKELFKRINILLLAIYRGESRTKLQELMTFLENYIIEHFNDEEELMRKNGYELIEYHINLHNEFSTLFYHFKDDFKKRGGDSYLSIRLEKEIRLWWENHILKADMNYVPYLTFKN